MSEQQQEYGGIIINGIDCSGGGGSSVTPNPPAPATETLSSLDINGVIYGIEQETRENIFSIFDTFNKNQKYADYSSFTPDESFFFKIEDDDDVWSSTATIYNNNAYDLTDIDKLELVVEITQQTDYAYLWVTFSQTKYTWNSTTWPGLYDNVDSALQITQSGSYEIDVSSLTGSYYIYIGATTGKDSTTHGGGCNNTHNGHITGTVTEFNIISTSSGTKVVPNPSGSATDTLEKLQIENTIYDFDAGTEVIANPTGTATADLNKISIGGIIYNITGGGSGGRGNFESTILYTGTQRDNTINLSDDYTNYDYLVLQGYATASPGFLNSNLISVNDITIGNNIGISDNSAFIWYTITDTDEFTFSDASGTYYIKAIYGLKESEGGGYLTLVPCYAEFIEGFNNTYWNTHLGQLNAEYFLDFYIDQYQDDRSILGSSGGPGRLHLTMYNNKWYTSAGNGEANFGDSTMITGRHTFRWNTISDSKILFDEQDTGLTCSQSEAKDINIYINNRSARSTNDTCTNSRMYEFKITAKDGTVLHDFKPYALYAGNTLIWKGVMDVVGGMEADGWFNVKEIPGGGTTLIGADIEANPSDSATDTLSTIKIGNTIYDIAGGSGGGSSAFIDTSNKLQTIQVTSGDDWSYIATQDCWATINPWNSSNSTPSQIYLDNVELVAVYNSRPQYAIYIKQGQTLLIKARTDYTYGGIYGLLQTSGGGSSEVSTLLYKATDTTHKNIQLSNSWTNYETLNVTMCSPDPTSSASVSFSVNTASITDGFIIGQGIFGYNWYRTFPSNATDVFEYWIDNGSSMYIDSVVGIKGNVSGGGNSFEKKTTAEYQALPLSDKEDPDKLYFIDNSGEQITELDNTNWVNSTEASMSISIINNKLTYAWSGGTEIGANSVYSVAIPASVNKIRFSITTGTSYYNTYDPTVERFKVFIGVRPTYTTGFIYPPNLSDWLVLKNFNTDNSVWEDELDLSNVSEDSYLYISGHGWNMTIDSLQLITESGDTTNNCIYYQNIKYADNASGGNVDDVYVNGESVLDTNKIAQVKTHKEISLAEYEDANDDIIYFVDDDDDELGIYYSPIIYSTEEREVGTWTDGKPLYQRTWVFSTAVTISSNSWQATNIAVADTKIEFITKCKANNTDGQMMNYISATTDNATQTYVMLFNSRTNASMDVKYLTLEYTKSTDTPGSAKYNALGVPMVHYSTDEQVIGTWIDGKPIYRKIYDWTASPFLVSTSWQNTDIDSTNIDRIIGAVGMHQDGTLYSDTCADPTKSSHTRVGIKAWADGYYAYLILEYTKTTD